MSQRIFTTQQIEDDGEKQPIEEEQCLLEDEYIDIFLQLKTNKLPKGVIELERLFDQDVVQENRPKEHIRAEEIEKVNMGIEQDPKYILLGKTCIG